MNSNRRHFLTATAGLGTAAWLSQTFQTTVAAEQSGSGIPAGSVILFQGDSITDAGRKRDAADQANQRAALGGGYAWLAASQLLVDAQKDTLKIFNRGISGNKVPDLAKRWDKDCLELKPDVLSILIGVNDLWHKLNGRYDGTVASYEQGYRELLERTRKSLPNVKLVLCEPFVLKCGAVNEKWFPEFDEMRAVARKMSEEFKTIFVPFQDAFDRAVEYAEPKEWAGDGVHPSSSGAALMAHEWIMAVAHGSKH